jgi:HD-like signal output (HDOD) protein
VGSNAGAHAHALTSEIQTLFHIPLYRPTLPHGTCAASRIPCLSSSLVALAAENFRCHSFPTSSPSNTLYDVLLPRDRIRTRCTMKEHPATPYLPAALQGGRHLTHPREIDSGPDALMRRAALGSLTFRAGNRSTLENGSGAGQGPAALQFLMNLSAELARGPVDLPCFPNVVMKIRDALNDPKTSVEETVKLVGAEPRLAARLLQTANSAAFSPSSARVSELRTAITRLGQQFVQGAAMSFAIQQMKDEPGLRSIANDLKELWKKSIVVASVCRVVAGRTKVKPDEAFLAGLLHGIGRLYIMAHAVGKFSALSLDPDCADVIATWHPSIGKAVLENWRVGEAIAESVGEQSNYARSAGRDADLTDILIVGIVLAEALGQAPLGRSQVEDIQSFRRIGLTLQDCHTTLKHAEYQLGALQEALGC